MPKRWVRPGRPHRLIVALTVIALLGHVAHLRAEELGHVTGPFPVHGPTGEGLFADHHAVPPAPCQVGRTTPTTIAAAPAGRGSVALVAPATDVGCAATSALVRSTPLFLLHSALLI